MKRPAPDDAQLDPAGPRTGDPFPDRPAADPEPAARGSFGLLRDRVYGPYWFGMVLSTSGIWVHNVVAAIVVFQLSGSTLMVGAVTVAQFLPQLLFAPLSGAHADRGDARRQLIVGRMITLTGSGGLALLVAVVGVDGLPGAWPVIASAGVVGIGFVVGGPAMHTLLPTLVRPAELSSAVALSHLPPTIARSGGPVLGTFLLVAAGPAVAFGFTALTTLAFAIIIVVLPIGRDRPRPAEADTTVRGGLRYLRTDPMVAFLLLGVLALGFGADPVVTLTPALSDGFGRGEELVGLFASGFGLGAAVVFPLLRPLRLWLGATGLGVGGLACLGVGVAAAGIAPDPRLVIVGLALAGMGFSFSITGLTTQIYARVPDAFRGRMMALWSVAFLGSRPIAAAINGAVADLASVTVAFLATAAIVGSIAVLTALGAHRHR